MIKLVLVNNIKDMALDIVNTQKMRKKAEQWANKLLTAYEKSPIQLDKTFAQHDSLLANVESTYVETLLRVLRDHGRDGAPIIRQM